MAQATTVRGPADVIPYLQQCGYAARDVRRDYRFGTDDNVAVAAFAHEPHDARSICIAVGTAGASPARTAQSLRPLGAPVLFLIGKKELEWWKPGPDRGERLDSCALAEVPTFFTEHRSDFAPEALFRAKNFGAHQSAYQLDFVDVGLLPFVERQMGEKLSTLIENLLKTALGELGVAAGQEPGPELFEWLFEAAFNLLAGKILHDKDVPGFRQLDLLDASSTVARVRRHYGQPQPFPEQSPGQGAVLAEMARRLAELSPLGNLTTETLGYIYEQALVTKDTRRLLGTHSTPSYLIDYVVWCLADWIEQIPEDRRHVYEPCCGHAGFLVAAMRLLRDLRTRTDPGTAAEHEYLKERLHGLEMDPFALEIARLGLTLADAPNPNGWDLRCDDIFRTRWPKAGASQPDIVFMNPPFETFGATERQQYGDGVLTHQCKATEVLARILPAIRPGGVFGVVMPQGVLHGKDGEALRRQLCAEFELREVTLLSDKVFRLSDAESAILLGRRGDPERVAVRIGRVDDWGVERFRERQELSDSQECPQQHLSEQPGCELRIPRLDDVWRELEWLPRLGSLVEGGQGFQHLGRGKLPPGARTVSDRRFPGAVRGFTTFGRKTALHGLPKKRWVSLEKRLLGAPRWGTVTGRPQVLLNYALVSRGPWRLKALLDPEGHAVTSRFVLVRPRQASLPLELIWALLNSPVGNAYSFCHLGKRDNTVGVLLKMPVPRLSQKDIDRVASAALRYLDAARSGADGLTAEPTSAKPKELLLQVDAEVLRLYDLRPRLERRLLDLFHGHKRQGVPFTFTEYFAVDFRPHIPLHEYLSPEYKRSTAGELRKRLRTFDDPEITRALQTACEAFTLEPEV